METRKEIAAEKKRCGSHNCTQAVLCTYHDFAGMEEETIKNAGNAFAAGMGNMEGTCGAIVGAGIILGLATQDKAKSVKGMRQIMDKFKQRNGATQCKLLKGVGTGKVLRECPLCVAEKNTYFLGFEFGNFSYDYYFCTRNKKPYLCDTMLCSCGFEYSFIKLKVLLYYDY